MIEKIEHDGQLLAIIVRQSYYSEGIEFFTPDDFSQQLGYMNRKSGYVIEPHIHTRVERSVSYTNEVLFIKKGLVQADFYDQHQNYLMSTMLAQGDIILLAFGGHGFKIIEDAEIFEVKQGPYAGVADKKRFVSHSQGHGKSK